jgi:hypothetical protein
LQAETVCSSLVGCDVAGSLVSIQVNKSGGNAEVVTLTRMSTEAMSDRRAMFDIFTNARNLSKQREDRATATLLDRAIILWTKMLDDDAKHNRRSEHTDETLLESYFFDRIVYLRSLRHDRKEVVIGSSCPGLLTQMCEKLK